jgi:isoleucyl-tRNA synthetase
VAIDNNLGVGLDLQLDDELVAEGVAREIVNRVQNMRKDAGLEVSDRIRIGVQGEAGLLEAIGQHREYIAAETLALELSAGALPDSVVLQQELQVNDYDCTIAIARA